MLWSAAPPAVCVAAPPAVPDPLVIAPELCAEPVDWAELAAGVVRKAEPEIMVKEADAAEGLYVVVLKEQERTITLTSGVC